MSVVAITKRWSCITATNDVDGMGEGIQFATPISGFARIPFMQRSVGSNAESEHLYEQTPVPPCVRMTAMGVDLGSHRLQFRVKCPAFRWRFSAGE